MDESLSERLQKLFKDYEVVVRDSVFNKGISMNSFEDLVMLLPFLDAQNSIYLNHVSIPQLNNGYAYIRLQQEEPCKSFSDYGPLGDLMKKYKEIRGTYEEMISEGTLDLNKTAYKELEEKLTRSNLGDKSLSEFLDVLIEYGKTLIYDINTKNKKFSRYLELDAPVMVVSDIQGNKDLFDKIMETYRNLRDKGKVKYLVFSGDLIHNKMNRDEDYSVEMIKSIYQYNKDNFIKNNYEDVIILLNGDHEWSYATKINIFEKDFNRKMNKNHSLEDQELALRVIRRSPAAIGIGNVLIQHGGPSEYKFWETVSTPYEDEIFSLSMKQIKRRVATFFSNGSDEGYGLKKHVYLVEKFLEYMSSCKKTRFKILASAHNSVISGLKFVTRTHFIHNIPSNTSDPVYLIIDPKEEYQNAYLMMMKSLEGMVKENIEGISNKDRVIHYLFNAQDNFVRFKTNKAREEQIDERIEELRKIEEGPLKYRISRFSDYFCGFKEDLISSLKQLINFSPTPPYS